jgi:ATP-dependent Clp protease adapter protein ClpS
VGNCDEFIFYDDLVKADEARKKASAKKQADAASKKTTEANAKKQKDQAAKKPNEHKLPAADEPATAELPDDARRMEAIEMVVETVEALMGEKDLDEVHASSVKNALKRRRPDFIESAYGYKAFGKILEDAEKRGLLEIHRHGQAVAVSLPR